MESCLYRECGELFGFPLSRPPYARSYFFSRVIEISMGSLVRPSPHELTRRRSLLNNTHLHSSGISHTTSSGVRSIPPPHSPSPPSPHPSSPSPSPQPADLLSYLKEASARLQEMIRGVQTVGLKKELLALSQSGDKEEEESPASLEVP